MVSKGNEESMRGGGRGGWASPCLETTMTRDLAVVLRAVETQEGLKPHSASLRSALANCHIWGRCRTGGQRPEGFWEREAMMVEDSRSWVDGIANYEARNIRGKPVLYQQGEVWR